MSKDARIRLMELANVKTKKVLNEAIPGGRDSGLDNVEALLVLIQDSGQSNPEVEKYGIKLGKLWEIFNHASATPRDRMNAVTNIYKTVDDYFNDIGTLKREALMYLQNIIDGNG